MAVYNGAPYLADQLESIKNQTRWPDELIIVDDCSTDESVLLAQRFARAASFPVSIHINRVNIGSTRTFDRAISLCRGDVIALADQDDVWNPTKLSSLEKVFLSRPDLGLVFSDAEVVDENLQPLGYPLWRARHFDSALQRKIRANRSVDVLLRYNVVTGATMAFRSSLRAVISPIPQIWVHDAWIAFVLACVTKLDYAPIPLIQYRQHAANQIGAGSVGIVERFQKAWKCPVGKHRKRLEVEIEQYNLLKQRVIEVATHIEKDVLARRLDEKLDHLRRRLELLRRGGVPALLLAAELVLLRYHRYSNGFRDIANDILYLLRAQSMARNVPGDKRDGA